jgi:hypothetical protein
VDRSQCRIWISHGLGRCHPFTAPPRDMLPPHVPSLCARRRFQRSANHIFPSTSAGWAGWDGAGTRSSLRAAATPAVGSASVRRRRVGAYCVQYSIFVSRNRFIASPAASDPYAGREPVALCCTRKPRGILGRVGYADAWDRSCGSACHFVGHWEHHTIPPKGAWDIICRKGPEIAKPTRNMTSPPMGARLHV